VHAEAATAEPQDFERDLLGPEPRDEQRRLGRAQHLDGVWVRQVRAREHEPAALEHDASKLAHPRQIRP
jgi:hypothetical protein